MTDSNPTIPNKREIVWAGSVDTIPNKRVIDWAGSAIEFCGFAAVGSVVLKEPHVMEAIQHASDSVGNVISKDTYCVVAEVLAFAAILTAAVIRTRNSQSIKHGEETFSRGSLDEKTPVIDVDHKHRVSRFLRVSVPLPLLYHHPR